MLQKKWRENVTKEVERRIEIKGGEKNRNKRWRENTL